MLSFHFYHSPFYLHMKKWLPIFLICLITFITLTPKVGIFAYTENDYYNAIGAYYLGNLIVSGNASDLDFSEGSGDENFLLALGEALVTGDYTSLAEWGLNTLDDTITNIKEFVQTSVYNVNPDIYDFLYSDSNVKINLTDGHITKNLFIELQHNDNPTPTPQPDPDYVTLIDYANAPLNGYGYFWGEYPTVMDLNGDVNTYKVEFIGDYNSHSWYKFNNGFVDFPNRAYLTDYCFPDSGILTLNIVNINNQYIGTISGIDSYQCGYIIRKSDNHVMSDYVCGLAFTSNTTKISPATGFTGNLQSSHSYTASTLYDVLSHFVHKFRNINIYVDGVPWAIVGNDDTNNISLGNQLTIINNYPAQYDYGQPIYFDMNGLITRIITAIQNKNVLTYEDIDDLIYDVNGNPVIGVLNFYRTDYDVLASEQIPYYPKFYYDNNLNQYLQAGANMINISTEVLPRDVLNILITSGVILLFGYVIRRLLE